jgi:hypothetical protein
MNTLDNFLNEFLNTFKAILILIQGIVAILLSRPLIFISMIVLTVIGGKGLKFNLGKKVNFQRGIN